MDFPLLAGLSENVRDVLLRSGRLRRFARSEVLFHEGDRADHLILLRAGHVTVRVTTPHGDTAIFSVLGPGASVGELALLAGHDLRSATVTAIDPVEALVVPARELARLRENHPEVDRFLVRLLYGYLRRHDQLLMEALYVPVEQRILRRLLELAELFASGEGDVVVPLTQETLAQLAGSSRPTANQVLKAAEAAGWLRVERGRIQVLDQERLRGRAGE